MSDFEMTMTGLEEVRRKIERLGPGMIAEAQLVGASVAEDLVLVPSRERAPKKSGRTRRSGVVIVRRYKDATIIKVSYGGELAPWARFIHEKVEQKFKVGEPKWLERTFREAMPRLAPTIGARFDLARAVRG